MASKSKLATVYFNEYKSEDGPAIKVEDTALIAMRLAHILFLKRIGQELPASARRSRRLARQNASPEAVLVAAENAYNKMREDVKKKRQTAQPQRAQKPKTASSAKKRTKR